MAAALTQQRLSAQLQQQLSAGPRRARPAKRLRQPGSQAAARQADTVLVPFPSEYDTMVRQAQLATKAALADGHKLLEVEFPVAGLAAAQGDSDGQNEMNLCMGYLRQFLRAFADTAGSTRVFFPDSGELAVARSGQTSDPSAGRQDMDAPFEEGCGFKFGFLTKQSAAWALFGRNIGSSFSPLEQVQDSDSCFVVAYPSFNPREELTAARQLYDGAAVPAGRPLILFNAELDRLRGGYYPAWGFPELAKLTKEWLPQMEAAFYIRNIKGSRPGVLFRAYPGPWQVLLRNPRDPEDTRCVWTSAERPSLKQVALGILPNALAGN